MEKKTYWDGHNTLKTEEEIREIIRRASPLALPRILEEIEIQDQTDATEVFDRAIKDLEGERVSGLLDTIMRPTVNSIYTGLMRQYGGGIKAIKGVGLESQSVYDDVIKFRYAGNKELGRDDVEYLRIEQEKDDKAAAASNPNYNRQDYADASRMSDFKRRQGKEINDEFRNQRIKVEDADVDHVSPLSDVHTKQGANESRYAPDKEILKQAANDDENLAMANKHDNRSKGAKTNEEYIESKEGDFSKKEQARMLNAQKKAEQHIRVELCKEGARTVSKEHIGRVVIMIVGPLYYELKEWFVSEGKGTPFADRLARMKEHIVKEVPRLLGELFDNLGQMLVRIFKDFLVGLVAQVGIFLEKLAVAVIDGFRVVCKVVATLFSTKLSAAERADVISKLLVGFVVSIVGKTFIDSLLENPMFKVVPAIIKDMLSLFTTALLTGVLLHALDRMDLFSVRAEKRLQRIREIFEKRQKERARLFAAFDCAVVEKMKSQEITWLNIKTRFDAALSSRDFDSLNDVADSIATFFDVKLPYSTPAEFVAYLRSNNGPIVIT